MKDKNSLFREIIRFAVIGVYGTLIDFLVELVFTSFLHDWVSANEANHIAAFFIAFLLSFIGMLIATPATWALTGVWGFQNVEEKAKKKANSVKGSLIYTGWQTAGLVGGAAIQFVGYMLCLEWSGWGINILSVDFSTLFKQEIGTFFAFTTVFVLKTAFTMVWNFVTRKLFIYKSATKKEAPDQAGR